MITKIIEFGQKQGFSITILLISSYLFWNKIEALERRVADCQNQKVEILTGVIINNTEAILSLQKQLEK